MKTVIGTLKVTSFFNLIPLSLTSSSSSSKTYSLKIKKFGWGWRLLAWHLINWILFFAQIFQITSFIHTLVGDVRGNAFAVHVFCLIASLFGSIFVLAVYMKQKEWILLLRQHEKLLGIISGESLPALVFPQKFKLHCSLILKNLTLQNLFFRRFGSHHNSMAIPSVRISDGELRSVCNLHFMAYSFQLIPLLPSFSLLPVCLPSSRVSNSPVSARLPRL